MRTVLGGNAQRAGNEIRVLGTIDSAKNIVLNNGIKLYIKNATGDLYSSITTDSSNNLVITNDNYNGDYIVLAALMSDSTTQRFMAFGEDGTSLLPKLWFQSDIKFDVTGALTIDTDDGVSIETYGLSVGYGTPPADGNILYTGSLISRKGTTNHTGYAYVPYTERKTSTSWTATNKTTANNDIIDLSAVFSVPAGVKAVSIRITMDSTTVGLAVGVGPSSGEWTYVIARAQVSGEKIDAAGIAACDANGDIYFNVDRAGTAAVTLVITGYYI